MSTIAEGAWDGAVKYDRSTSVDFKGSRHSRSPSVMLCEEFGFMISRCFDIRCVDFVRLPIAHLIH